MSAAVASPFFGDVVAEFDAQVTNTAGELIEAEEAFAVGEELYLILFFCLGFLVFRRIRGLGGDAEKRKLLNKSEEKGADNLKETAPMKACTLESLREDLEGGRHENVIQRWEDVPAEQLSDALPLAASALLAANRAQEVGLVVAKAVAKAPQLRASLHLVVDEVASASNLAVRAAGVRDLCDQARCELDARAAEALLAALTALGDGPRAAQLLEHLTSVGATARRAALVGVSRLFLASGDLDATLHHLRAALAAPGAEEPVPADFVVAVVQRATETALAEESDVDARKGAGAVLELLEVSGDAAVPGGAFVHLLEWAARQNPVDLDFTKRAERRLRALAGQARLPMAACDALTRAYAACGLEAAVACFDELAAAGEADAARVPSEASLVGMLSACLEAQNADLAEHILLWARANGRCSAAVLSVGARILAARLPPTADASPALSSEALEAPLAPRRRQLSSRVPSPPRAWHILEVATVLQAKEALRELRDRGEDAGTSTHNCALDACVSCGDAKAAQALFAEMRQTGKLDAVSFNILLKQHVSCEKGNNSRLPPASPAIVDAMLEEMKACGVSPNVATYNSVLSGALATWDTRRAWRTLVLMEAANVGADAYTVSILLRGHKRDRQTMDVEAFDKCLAIIERHRVQVDEVLVNAALEACVGMRDAAKLSRTMGVLTSHGWDKRKQCTMTTFGLLIKAHGQSHQLAEAWGLWEEATSRPGTIASEQLYGQMIDVLVGSGKIEDAVKLFREMQTNYGDRLNSQGFAVAYAMIVRGYAQRKDCVRALQCYDEMKQHGVRAGPVIFNTVIDACSRVGDMDGAARLFTDMIQADCVPDLITYSTLIKGYCVTAETDKAMKLLELMRRKRIEPDAIVFNSLLDGCAKNQQPDMCERIIQEMVEAGVAPSNHSASILIKLYGRQRNMEAAFRIIDEMPAKYGFRPNAAVYTCLMSTCISCGQLGEAMKLRERMILDKCLPDEKTYSTLLRGALKTGGAEQGVTTVRAALKQGGAKYLLDEELLQSVLDLIQRRRLWEAYGADIFEQLQEAQINVRMPRQQPQGGDHQRRSQGDQRRGQGQGGHNYWGGQGGHAGQGGGRPARRPRGGATESSAVVVA